MGDKKASGRPEETPARRNQGASAAMAAPRQRDLKDYIGRRLKAMYDEVANQPVPDRFQELLDRLEQKTRGE